MTPTIPTLEAHCDSIHDALNHFDHVFKVVCYVRARGLLIADMDDGTRPCILMLVNDDEKDHRSYVFAVALTFDTPAVRDDAMRMIGAKYKIVMSQDAVVPALCSQFPIAKSMADVKAINAEIRRFQDECQFPNVQSAIATYMDKLIMIVQVPSSSGKAFPIHHIELTREVFNELVAEAQNGRVAEDKQDELHTSSVRFPKSHGTVH